MRVRASEARCGEAKIDDYLLRGAMSGGGYVARSGRVPGACRASERRSDVVNSVRERVCRC